MYRNTRLSLLRLNADVGTTGAVTSRVMTETQLLQQQPLGNVQVRQLWMDLCDNQAEP